MTNTLNRRSLLKSLAALPLFPQLGTVSQPKDFSQWRRLSDQIKILEVKSKELLRKLCSERINPEKIQRGIDNYEIYLSERGSERCWVTSFGIPFGVYLEMSTPRSDIYIMGNEEISPYELSANISLSMYCQLNHHFINVKDFYNIDREIKETFYV